MTNYCFATLAIGTSYNYKVRTMIDCVTTLTTGDMVVITDDVQELQEHLDYLNTETDISDRVKLISIEDVTDENVWYDSRKFNYNLKRLPVTVANASGDYDMIIHSDADTLFIYWNEEEFQDFIRETDAGLIARLRNRPSEEAGLHWIIEDKSNKLSIDMNEIKARMPIEVYMFFKPKAKNFDLFLSEWKDITDRCYMRGIDPFIEALEICYALDQSKMKSQDILSFIRKYKTLNNLRYLHHDKIMKII